MTLKRWNAMTKRQRNLPIGIATAVFSLLFLAALVANAMGQPLLTGQELLSAWQVVQFIAAGVLLLVAGALGFWFVVVVVLPIRDNALSHRWERQQESATEQHQVAAPSERPIIVQHSGSNLALKAERAKRENLQVLLDSITDSLSQLCYQVTGQQEPDAVRAIKVLGDGWSEMRETMRELDAQLSESAPETPQERVGTSPRGATWQDVLALMEWARERDRVPMRATRDLLRKMQVQIPEREIGAFSATVQALGPLPRQASGAVESKKQATDGGQAPKGQRPRTRTLPRKKLTRV